MAGPEFSDRTEQSPECSAKSEKVPAGGSAKIRGPANPFWGPGSSLPISGRRAHWEFLPSTMVYVSCVNYFVLHIAVYVKCVFHYV
jgi:hypothetical protein